MLRALERRRASSKTCDQVGRRARPGAACVNCATTCAASRRPGAASSARGSTSRDASRRPVPASHARGSTSRDASRDRGARATAAARQRRAALDAGLPTASARGRRGAAPAHVCPVTAAGRARALVTLLRRAARDHHELKDHQEDQRRARHEHAATPRSKGRPRPTRVVTPAAARSRAGANRPGPAPCPRTGARAATCGREPSARLRLAPCRSRSAGPPS